MGNNSSSGLNLEGLPSVIECYGEIGDIKGLLDRGCDINETNRDGQTGLIVAAIKKEGSVVKLLLDRGAFRHIEDNKGNTFLDYLPEEKKEECEEYIAKELCSNIKPV